jgi:hypothetical protein
MKACVNRTARMQRYAVADAERRGPWRRIKTIEQIGIGLFDPDVVVLECGHQVLTLNLRHVRCAECLNSPRPQAAQGVIR